MSLAIDPDSVGPVDVASFVFPGNQFNGDVAPALVELHDSGIVRIIDLAFVVKDADGNTESIEVEDAEVADAFARISNGQLDLLSGRHRRGRCAGGGRADSCTPSAGHPSGCPGRVV